MLDRRQLLISATAGAALPAAIARAAGIDARVRTGTIQDVEHVVILMQENRSFDHYFGVMNGVRGFGDRFPIPLPGGRTVWTQANSPGAQPTHIAPFPLNTTATFAHMRVAGTPHSWTDAQAAWDQGRMADWPAAKRPHSMGYFEPADLPFQYALANAFTLCDAYHCSMQVGTNSNRLFLFTGANDPGGKGGGPSLSNSHDSLPQKGGPKTAYSWMTYPERLQAAGVTWRVYQDMADNFSDNPLEGFASFRAAYDKAPGAQTVLATEGLSTYQLDRLQADVMADALPQVSYIVAGAKDSEHPDPSSPAQGSDYTARVLDALTANPEVWARTVLLVMFDENDGFFDHAPPPAPPSRDATGALLGGSSVDLTGEHHLTPNPAEPMDLPKYRGRPYGLGPRVPMYVISPWSRGGWVNSQVFDHTSVIRFLEARFGVASPEISPWRRAVCGDLTSCFDFRTPNRERTPPKMPATRATAERAAALGKTTRPPTPAAVVAPEQAAGIRLSRALPYDLNATLSIAGDTARVDLANTGAAAAVLHVYDLNDLSPPPRRYTVAAGKTLDASWPLTAGGYDLWVLGPNGFHRHFRSGTDPGLIVTTGFDRKAGKLTVTLRNTGARPLSVQARANAYGHKAWVVTTPPGATVSNTWALSGSRGWHDLSLTLVDHPDWLRRVAGRLENGRDSVSDPAMFGPAIMTRA
ncbi:phosphocholine-specific phospholipase C [Phenylobacterium sp.]|jgi:phospholipase C|uniref:phosphocholine-specific phospholipase C n=1 Tax=Phenylobacterium sp. TaxID=1871053 RepID=UPI0037C58DA4